MNVDNIEIVSYDKNSKVSLELKVFLCSLVVGFLLVCLVVVMNLLKKDLYYQNNLIIISNHNVMFNVLKDDLDIIKDNSYLIIDNKKYYYHISSIELVNDINVYYRVNLDLDNNLLVNSINSFRILIREESLFNYIVRIVRGG